MTVRELIKCLTCDLYITFDEDPNGISKSYFEIRVSASLDNPADALNDFVLDHPIHLMTAKDDAICISLFIYNDKGENGDED